MPEASSVSAEVRFLDRAAVLDDLRRAAAAVRLAHPDILRIFLIGSLVRGNWTAASDADVVVVVEREFADLLERSRYQIHSAMIPTDTLVYTKAEFEALAADPHSVLSQNLACALEL